MAKTVIGLIDNLGQAQAAVRELVESSIAQEDIGFMADQRHELPGTAHLNESEGTLTGAGTGAALGGMAGLALALAPLAIPGVGPILAAGPIAAALAGAGLGAVAGGLIGGLTRLGVPEEQAHYYGEALRRGGILITVAADQAAQADLAAAILERHGAVDIEQRAAQWKKQGWKGRFEAGAQPKPAKRARTKAQKLPGKAA